MDAMKRIGRLAGSRFVDVLNGSVMLTHPLAKVFYVDSTLGDSTKSGEDIRSPLPTLAAAYAKCTADHGDIIAVLPGHSETISSTLTISKAGVQIVGFKWGNRIPIITVSGAIDGISVEAANVTIQGLRFAGPAVDAQTADINVAAAYCSIIDTVHIGSVATENKVAIITLTADADDCLIDGVKIYNTVVEVPSAIVLEGALTNVTIKNTFVMDSVGFTNGAISDGAAATGVIIQDSVFQNAKAATAVIKFSNSSVGFGINVGVSGRHTTIASNISGAAFEFFPAYVTEEAAKSGMVWTVDAD